MKKFEILTYKFKGKKLLGRTRFRREIGITVDLNRNVV
jgi:hypothetical protein